MKYDSRKYNLVLGIAVASLVLGASTQVPGLLDNGAEDGKPNVAIIMVNNLRPDHLSCNGYQRNTTPNICEFGRENIVFENTVTQAPWTLPSTVSFFLSQYPSVHGVTTMRERISNESVTLTEVFKSEGYRTGAFVGNRRCEGGHLKSWYGYGQGFDTYHQRGPWFNTSVPRAIEWLEKGEEKEPYFVFVHGYDPHAPYGDSTVNTSFMESYDGLLRDYILNFGRTDDSYILDNIERRDGRLVAVLSNRTINITAQDMEYIRAMYDRDVRAADEQVGSFIDYLKEEGEYENTIVVVASNHGTKLGERSGHGAVFGHDFPYRGVTGGVLMMHVPGYEARSISTPAEIIDIYPTLLELAGFQLDDQDIQGESLLNALSSEAGDYPDRYVFTEGNSFSTVAVRNREWKMIDPSYSNENIYIRMKDSEPVEVPSGQVPEEVKKEFKRQVEEWRLSNSKLNDSSSRIKPTGGCNDDLLDR